MKLFFLFNFIFFSNLQGAEWFCDKQKSFAEGNKFYSCGLGTANTQEVACKKALKSAHDEFEYTCENSYHCKGREKIVKPGRTKVTSKNGVFTCLRAVEYKILDIKKSDKEDLELTESQIRDKIRELELMKKKLRKYKELERIERDIKRRKRAIASLKKSKKRKQPVAKGWKWLGPNNRGRFIFGLGLINEPYYDDSFFSFEFTYRKFLLANFSHGLYFGLGGSLIYSIGGSPDDSYNSSGCYSHCSSEPKNNPEIVKASVSDFYAFIPIKYKNFELSFESGSAKFSYDLKSWTYNNGYYYKWRMSQSYFKNREGYSGFGIRYFFKGTWSIAYKSRKFKEKSMNYIIFGIGR
ncbi:hypothetical protein OAK75_11880 [Bacteriovoracales bacterium]|nr:hypothetical protein [Bacteriovoracales bacterium]